VSRHILERTARGVAYVTAGKALLSLAGLAGGIVLARRLSPWDFGVYAVISFVVVTLNALTELGLSAKLIHDIEAPSLREQRSLFTVHCLIAVAGFTAVWLAAPSLAPLFQLGDEAVEFWRFVGCVILLHPLRTVPVGLLNRRLRYDRLSAVDVVQGIVYQAGAVALAVVGFGYWSFGIAAVLSSAVTAAVVNAFAPWRTGFAWDVAYLQRTMRFGGAFQLSSLTAIARDNIITFLAGPLFGPSAVGLLNWALRLAWVCTQTYVAICVHVAFPSLSRLRENRATFRTALARMLRYVNLATFCTVSVVTALAPEIVHVVFTDRWAPAIPFFYCFAIRMVASNYTTLFDLALKADGRPGTALKILTAWTVWEWAGALTAAYLIGPFGIAASAAVAIWLALVWMYYEVRRVVPIELWPATAVPALAAAVTFAMLYVGKAHLVTSLPALGASAALGVLAYGAVVFLTGGRRFRADVRRDAGTVLRGVGSEMRLAPEAAD
jgi:PST family polysaccharide transporter